MARKTQERQKCCWIEQLGTPLGRDELGRSRGENDIEPLSTISGVQEHGLVLPVSGCAHKARVWGAKAAAGITLSQTAPRSWLLALPGCKPEPQTLPSPVTTETRGGLCLCPVTPM